MSYGLKYYKRGQESDNWDIGRYVRKDFDLCYDVKEVERIFKQLEETISKLADYICKKCGKEGIDFVESLLAGCE